MGVDALVGDGDAGAKVMGVEIVNDLVREVMDIDDEVVIATRHELGDDVVQQRLAAHGHERLGHRVRDGFQAGAEPRGKDHRFHNHCSIPRSRWMRCTLTGYFATKCSARC